MIDETRYKETVQTTEVNRPRMAVETVPSAETEYVKTVEYVPTLRRSSWGAIWAGAVIAVGIQVLLTVLGAAIGLSIAHANYDPATSSIPQGIGVGAGIWWICSGIVSLFVGGWAAGAFARPCRAVDGALHGFVMWCLVTTISAILVTSMGGALLGGGMSAIANNSQSSGNDTLARFRNGVHQPTNDGSNSAVTNHPSNPDNRVNSNTLGNNLNPNNPNSSVDNDPNGFTENTLTPRERANIERAARNSAAASWWTFFALLLGVTAAVLGGSMGTARDERVITEPVT